MSSVVSVVSGFVDTAQSDRDVVERSANQLAGRDAFTAFASELILGPQTCERKAVSDDIVQQLKWCTAEEGRSEELCAEINYEANRRGRERALIELVGESQLSIAVAAHAGGRGEVVVKNVIPELFAILTTRS